MHSRRWQATVTFNSSIFIPFRTRRVIQAKLKWKHAKAHKTNRYVKDWIKIGWLRQRRWWWCGVVWWCCFAPSEISWLNKHIRNPKMRMHTKKTLSLSRFRIFTQKSAHFKRQFNASVIFSCVCGIHFTVKFIPSTKGWARERESKRRRVWLLSTYTQFHLINFQIPLPPPMKHGHETWSRMCALGKVRRQGYEAYEDGQKRNTEQGKRDKGRVIMCECSENIKVSRLF